MREAGLDERAIGAPRPRATRDRGAGRLTRADQAIGDGDHGVGMARGFRAARAAIEARQAATVGELFKAAGMAILSSSGGASGAVFGTFFISAAGALPADILDGRASPPRSPRRSAGVQKRGGAEPGDKTVVDALAPGDRRGGYARRPRCCSSAAAAQAAEDGAEATRPMVARFGKAKTLGDRSIGHPTRAR